MLVRATDEWHTRRAVCCDRSPPAAWSTCGGFLPCDPQRIICDTWQEAAEGW
jgi:hypothetical protein